MDSEDRRKKILNLLTASKKAIKGASIAEKFNVSRQVIVQDIAILRAEGKEIMASPKGYIMIRNNNNIKKTIVSVHRKEDNIEDELNIIVDLGGRILDVIVEHPIYGEIKGQLMISSRKDVKDFLKKMDESNAPPLSILTQGIHIHTIEVPNEKIFNEIKKELKDKKILID